MPSYFQGAYVEEVRDATVAGIISGSHVVMIGPPGCGKKSMGRDIASRVVPFPEAFVFKRLDASTPPEEVSGLADPAEAISVPPRIVYNREGTFYDPRAKIIMADEFFRPSDVIFDRLLDVMNRQDIDADKAPVVIGTSNFSSNTERTEALRDRFSIWLHINPGSLNHENVVRAHLASLGNGNTGKLIVPGRIPTWAEVEQARLAVPGPKATDAIVNVIHDLTKEAAEAGFEINNNRRDEQWSRILFRMGYYYSGGNADFDVVPDKARQVLKFCYPTTDVKDFQRWSEVTRAIADVVGSAISSVMAEAYKKFLSIRAGAHAGQEAETTMALATALQESERSLAELGKGDTRVGEAIVDLRRSFTKVVRGEDPMS